MQTEAGRENNLVWKKLEKNIQVSHFRSSAGSGSKVYVKKFIAPRTDPTRHMTIFLLHDLGQYHGRFMSFINWTQTHCPGISFVAMDFVGHGLSSGTRGHINSMDCLVQDFLQLLNQSQKAPLEKWYILGHGLGGLVALDFMNRFQDIVDDKIDGLILSNFILKFPSAFLQFESHLSFLSNILSGLISSSRPLRVMKGEEILSDPESILAYEHDPLVNQHPTLITIKEVQKKVANIYQDSYFIGKPLLMLKSESDNSINSGGIDYFVKGVKKELLTEKKYSLLKHDLYNESEREVVFLDIMNWIKMYEN